MKSIIITEKSSQAADVKAAVGDQYEKVYAAQGHLLVLEEPGEANPDWMTWGFDLCAPKRAFMIPKRRTRPDRFLIQESIIKAAKTAATEDRMCLTEDVAAAMHSAAEDEALDNTTRRRLREMSHATGLFCEGFTGEVFNRAGQSWPEADVTVIDLATFAREGYEAHLAISVVSCLNMINNIAERDQFEWREIVVTIDEAHIITTNPLLAPFLVKIVKMWRKLGAWLWLCIGGIPPWPTLKVTLKVKHRLPELVVGAWHANGEADWSFLDTVSPAVAWSLDGGATSQGGQPAGRAHSSLKFKNIAAVGSPAAVLTSAWRRPEMAKFFDVNVTYKTKPDPRGREHPPLKYKVLSANNPIMQQIVLLAEFGIGSVAEKLRLKGLKMPAVPSRLFKRGAGWVQVYYNVISWLFCRNAAIPMVPYHTTAMDPAWRLPWLEVPMVLSHPLQSTGGKKRLFPRLYPRVGFVKTSQDYKAGFAAARRSLDLVYTSRSSMAHVALRLPTSGSAGQWPPQLNSPWVYQQFAPTSHGCRSLPDRTESVGKPKDGYADRISENGSYTWQTWRYYKCCKKPGNCMLLFDFG